MGLGSILKPPPKPKVSGGSFLYSLEYRLDDGELYYTPWVNEEVELIDYLDGKGANILASLRRSEMGIAVLTPIGWLPYQDDPVDMHQLFETTNHKSMEDEL